MAGRGGTDALPGRVEAGQQRGGHPPPRPVLRLQPGVVPGQLRRRRRRRRVESPGSPESHRAALVELVRKRQGQVLPDYSALRSHRLPEDGERRQRRRGELFRRRLHGSRVQPFERGQTEDSDGGEYAPFSGRRPREEFLRRVRLVRLASDDDIYVYIYIYRCC